MQIVYDISNDDLCELLYLYIINEFTEMANNYSYKV